MGAEAVAAAARRDLMAQMDRILAGFVVRTGCRRGANTFLNFFEEKLVR